MVSAAEQPEGPTIGTSVTLMTDFIIFDDNLGQFGPLTDLRPASRLRTGAQLTSQRQSRRLGGEAVAQWVHEALADVLREHEAIPVNELPEGDSHLCVNGRWSALEQLPVPGPGEALLDQSTGAVVMAHLDAGDAEPFLDSGTLPDSTVTSSVETTLYNAPWDILDHLEAALADDLPALGIPAMAEDQVSVHGAHGVHLHPGAAVLPGVTADTSAGPVVINDGATIRCNAVLCGPCYVGLDSTIMDGALLKPRTVIGPGCRVGGEVGGSIFQGFSNKAHDGHLGDSILGRWVNLGAGTNNSNLLNTYSEVIMRLSPEGQSSRTGRIFMGCIIGDHVKTAIGTRIMTGSVLGTGSMIASTSPPPTTVDAFSWLTDRGASMFRTDKFLDVARTVMARRECTLGPGEEAALVRLAEAATSRRSG